jgi:enamine deaminase RidA (YjgF/YER057c/UK114 family)
MTRSCIRSGGGFEDVAAYSRAVRVGQRIVTSGTAALDASGVALYPGDAEAQTRAAITAAVAGVTGLGGRIEDVTRTRIYLAAGADWRGTVSAHREAFAGINPANTTVIVHSLIPEGALVEVELEAEVEAQAGGDERAEGADR